MSLRKVGNVWIYRGKMNGKTWDRSTRETDKRKAVARIPKLTLERKTKQRDLTEAELIRFFAACNGDQQVLFSFRLATGARPAELLPSDLSAHAALLKKYLDPESCTTKIRSAKLMPNQKTKMREIPISSNLMAQVWAFAQHTSRPHVFTLQQRLC